MVVLVTVAQISSNWKSQKSSVLPDSRHLGAAAAGVGFFKSSGEMRVSSSSELPLAEVVLCRQI